MKKITAILVALALSVPLFAQENLYGKILSDSERTALESGETIIKSLKNYKNFSINYPNPGVEQIQSITKKLKPAYLAEVIKMIPYEGNEDIFSKINEHLTDVNGYVGIPYYSEHNDIWVDLYASCNVISSEAEEGSSKTVADLYMEPFGYITTEVETHIYDDYYIYVSQNLNTIKYSGFTAVSKNDMKSLICVFRYGDNWVLYGIGAVDAPDVFFMHDRIELSFMNRIKTFCKHIFNLL